jgi:hypothetical protein
MDATSHYRHLAAMGRAAFLASAAPAALLRRRGGGGDYDGLAPTGTYDEPIGLRKGAALPSPDPEDTELEVLPLVKKPGAQWGDRITIGRTSNNDVVIAHHTVSRLHVYFRHRDGRWWVTDAGSKNGTALRDADLVARKETALADGDPLWIGDIEVVFHVAPTLYSVLGGR